MTLSEKEKSEFDVTVGRIKAVSSKSEVDSALVKSITEIDVDDLSDERVEEVKTVMSGIPTECFAAIIATIVLGYSEQCQPRLIELLAGVKTFPEAMTGHRILKNKDGCPMTVARVAMKLECGEGNVIAWKQRCGARKEIIRGLLEETGEYIADNSGNNTVNGVKEVVITLCLMLKFSGFPQQTCVGFVFEQICARKILPCVREVVKTFLDESVARIEGDNDVIRAIFENMIKYLRENGADDLVAEILANPDWSSYTNHLTQKEDSVLSRGNTEFSRSNKEEKVPDKNNDAEHIPVRSTGNEAPPVTEIDSIDVTGNQNSRNSGVVTGLNCVVATGVSSQSSPSFVSGVKNKISSVKTKIGEAARKIADSATKIAKGEGARDVADLLRAIDDAVCADTNEELEVIANRVARECKTGAAGKAVAERILDSKADVFIKKPVLLNIVARSLCNCGKISDMLIEKTLCLLPDQHLNVCAQDLMKLFSKYYEAQSSPKYNGSHIAVIRKCMKHGPHDRIPSKCILHWATDGDLRQLKSLLRAIYNNASKIPVTSELIKACLIILSRDVEQTGSITATVVKYLRMILECIVSFAVSYGKDAATFDYGSALVKAWCCSVSCRDDREALIKLTRDAIPIITVTAEEWNKIYPEISKLHAIPEFKIPVEELLNAIVAKLPDKNAIRQCNAVVGELAEKIAPKMVPCVMRHLNESNHEAATELMEEIAPEKRGELVYACMSQRIARGGDFIPDIKYLLSRETMGAPEIARLLYEIIIRESDGELTLSLSADKLIDALSERDSFLTCRSLCVFGALEISAGFWILLSADSDKSSVARELRRRICGDQRLLNVLFNELRSHIAGGESGEPMTKAVLRLFDWYTEFSPELTDTMVLKICYNFLDSGVSGIPYEYAGTLVRDLLQKLDNDDLKNMLIKYGVNYMTNAPSEQQSAFLEMIDQSDAGGACKISQSLNAGKCVDISESEWLFRSEIVIRELKNAIKEGNIDVMNDVMDYGRAMLLIGQENGYKLTETLLAQVRAILVCALEQNIDGASVHFGMMALSAGMPVTCAREACVEAIEKRDSRGAVASF